MSKTHRAAPLNGYTPLEHAIEMLPPDAAEKLRADGRELIRQLQAWGATDRLALRSAPRTTSAPALDPAGA